MKPTEQKNQSPLPTSSSVANTTFDKTDKKIGNRYIVIGYLIIFLFFGSVVAWSSIAPMSSAAIAPGVVGKDGYRKTVQHLEGGIIHEILVSEGDSVQADQHLIELKSIQSRSGYELLFKKKLIAEAKMACYSAEQKGLYGVPMSLPDGIDLNNVPESVKQSIQGEVDAFYFRRNLYDDQLSIINQRLAQAQEKINALETEQQTLRNKDSMITEEQKVYLEFEKKAW